MAGSITRNIVVNTLSRFIAALVSLSLVVIGSRELGAEGMGEISLVVLAVTVSQLASGLLSGSGIIYVASRHPVSLIFWIASLWSIITNFLVIWILYFFGLFPEEYFTEALWLGVAASFGQVGINLMYGKELIVLQSITGSLQSLLQLAFLVSGFYVLDFASVSWFLESLIVFHCLPWLISLIYFSGRLFRWDGGGEMLSTTRLLMKQGMYIQVGSGAQLLNYRLGYYFIEFLQGTAVLGVFSVGVQVAEGVLIISRSLGSVLYARVSNAKDHPEAARLTSVISKLSVIVTAAFFLLIFLFPTSFFIFLLGNEFGEARYTLVGLSPGILCLSITIILSAYFSGRGKANINMKGSLLGLLVTALLGYPLVWEYGLTGGIMMMCLSYTVSFLFAEYLFIRKSGLKASEILFSKSDWILLRGFFSRFFSKQ